MGRAHDPPYFCADGGARCAAWSEPTPSSSRGGGVELCPPTVNTYTLAMHIMKVA